MQIIPVGTATIMFGPLETSAGVPSVSHNVLDTEIWIDGVAYGSAGTTVCVTSNIGVGTLNVANYTVAAGPFRIDIQSSGVLPWFDPCILVQNDLQQAIITAANAISEQLANMANTVNSTATVAYAIAGVVNTPNLTQIIAEAVKTGDTRTILLHKR